MKKTAEKGKKIVFGVLLVLACILMPQKMTNAAGNTVPTAVDNLTVSLRNKVNMAVTDNGYMRVVYDGSKVRVEYYDTQFNLQRKGSLDLELPIWGLLCRAGCLLSCRSTEQHGAERHQRSDPGHQI